MRIGLTTYPHYFFAKNEKGRQNVRKERKRYKAITFQDRQIIEKRMKDGISTMELAAIIGVHIATMYRELERGKTENGYSAMKAQCEIGK